MRRDARGAGRARSRRCWGLRWWSSWDFPAGLEFLRRRGQHDVRGDSGELFEARRLAERSPPRRCDGLLTVYGFARVAAG